MTQDVLGVPEKPLHTSNGSQKGTIQTDQKEKNQNLEENKFVPRLRWPDLVAQIFIHLGCIYGLYLCVFSARIYTTIFALATIYFSGFGITAGAHRLWSHRAYKAKWPLKLILMILFTITGQRHVYVWALDHRVHHKYGETNADPHNAKRGFVFSHVGWLVLTPHPDVVEKRRVVDMSDLEADPWVVWQRRLYPPLFFLFVILFPIGTPVYFWNETLWNSFWVNFNFRFSITLNIAFFVNSVAHMWGQKPYEKSISPVENMGVALATLGEGWHNYHHVFPWDYRAGEHGNKYNPTTTFLNFMARIGWAYDLKAVSTEMIARRAKRSGDGSYIDKILSDDHHHEDAVWGYGDKDLAQEDQDELDRMKEELKLE